ncbi:hypothetical protein SLS63_008222 [Diaporthe eres]|uniref:Uncharacterized protein n=1 Tax=Diaporthe eres TaxID=83184 RepID=A0ABR1P2Y4_DIAER
MADQFPAEELGNCISTTGYPSASSDYTWSSPCIVIFSGHPVAHHNIGPTFRTLLGFLNCAVLCDRFVMRRIEGWVRKMMNDYMAEMAGWSVRGAYRKRSFTDHDGSDILWQKARALWKGGRALLATGDESKELEAQNLLDAAIKIYWDVRGTAADEPSMTDSTWDPMVSFQYR